MELPLTTQENNLFIQNGQWSTYSRSEVNPNCPTTDGRTCGAPEALLSDRGSNLLPILCKTPVNC